MPYKPKPKKPAPRHAETAVMATRMLSKRAGQRTQKFSDVFKERIASIEIRLAGVGSNWSELCRLSGVSRAQPNRYTTETPKTIRLIDQLEEALAGLEKKHKA